MLREQLRKSRADDAVSDASRSGGKRGASVAGRELTNSHGRGNRALAEFAATLRYEDIPAPVIAITKACIIDTVAVALFGSSLPWSRSVEDFARHVGSNGASTILSPALRACSAPAAALANGTFAHAFEFDNLRQPSIGVHPGSTATVAALAVAEEYGVVGP